MWKLISPIVTSTVKGMSLLGHGHIGVAIFQYDAKAPANGQLPILFALARLADASDPTRNGFVSGKVMPFRGEGFVRSVLFRFKEFSNSTTVLAVDDKLALETYEIDSSGGTPVVTNPNSNPVPIAHVGASKKAKAHHATDRAGFLIIGFDSSLPSSFPHDQVAVYGSATAPDTGVAKAVIAPESNLSSKTEADYYFNDGEGFWYASFSSALPASSAPMRITATSDAGNSQYMDVTLS